MHRDLAVNILDLVATGGDENCSVNNLSADLYILKHNLWLDYLSATSNQMQIITLIEEVRSC